MRSYDLVVIGAGILGLAVSRELLSRYPRLRLAVLDKEPAVGQHQSGHNSGVLHSGIYYAPGSLKAKLCVQGQKDVYAYCEEKGIPTDRCGKVIVASTEEEIPRLESLLQRGQANGVEGLEMIGPERLHEIEPYCAGVKALWSPNTGIVDFNRVVRAYAEDVVNAGGEVLPGYGVTAISDRPGRVVLQTTAGEVEAQHVVACAGLHADRVARLSGGPPDPRIVPFRGDYWVLRPDRRYLAKNLIYPVPDPSFPFLGVHFTRRMDDGSVWLGPNAVLAFSREGYGRLDLRPRDLGEALAYPGFLKLARKFWQTGMQEMVRDFSKEAFLKSLQVYIPELTMADLLPGPSGVRAQALGPDGTLVDDFVFNTQGTRIVHVRNAPSPGATSSLAIGSMIADTASQAFGLAA
ncbi:MAG TPA: L-2-hydroxyglutarate oxidase [Chloroflexota bacterium]